ncbi:MAG: hypothetical protein JXA03_00265 [Bacteroidales bacterium]|nr:hypothetical protein [Bacteroidales bacterium]
MYLLPCIFSISVAAAFIFCPAGVFTQELPLSSQKSEYRIRIPLPETDHADSLKAFTEETGNKLRANVFLSLKDGNYLLDAGDYRKKSYARSKLSRVKRDYRKARIVKADNSSIIFFSLTFISLNRRSVMPLNPVREAI